MSDKQSVTQGLSPLATLYLALLFAGLSISCSNPEQSAREPEAFPIIHPKVADTVVQRQYVADIQSIRNVEVRARVTGFLERIHVDEGATVKAGQLLFSINSQPFRDEVKKANALLKSALADAKAAEVELANTRKLVDNNIVSHSELELAQAKLEAMEARVEEARSALSTAQLNLSYAAIRAPFDGKINRIPKKEGSLVDEGTLLTTITNSDEVFAYFNLSEREYLQFIRRGDNGDGTVSLITADNELYPHTGRIETIDSEIDKTTGTIAFRARFPNAEQLLKHGASGKVMLNTTVKDAMIIPQKSTFEIQGNLYVYVVNDDDVVEMRPVTPRLRLRHSFIIDKGLSTDDRLILEGIQHVSEGDRVRPQYATTEPDRSITLR